MKYLPLALVVGITAVSGSAGSTGVTRPTISLTIPSMSNPKNITNTSNIPDPLKNKTNTPIPVLSATKTNTPIHHPPTTAPEAEAWAEAWAYALPPTLIGLFMCCGCYCYAIACCKIPRPDVEMTNRARTHEPQQHQLNNETTSLQTSTINSPQQAPNQITIPVELTQSANLPLVATSTNDQLAVDLQALDPSRSPSFAYDGVPRATSSVSV